MGDQIREVDAFGRWGGEEFLIVVPEARTDEASPVAERLRQRIERGPWNGVGPVTASLGVAQFEPGDTSDRILSRADRALYRAKEQGRNAVVVG